MQISSQSSHPTIHPIIGRAGCIYLAGTDDSYLLVDTGFPSTAAKLLRYIKNELDTAPDVVRTVVLTHSHVDHISGADVIIGESGAHLAVHRNAEYYLTGSKALPITSPASYLGFARFLVTHGLPGPSFTDWFRMPWAGIPGIRKGIKADVNVLLEDGDTVPGFEDWTVIHTPGHTDDGICLYNAELKAMFTGDTVINDKGTVKMSNILVRDKTALRKSVKKLRQHEVDYLCPGWGMPVKGRNILAGIS